MNTNLMRFVDLWVGAPCCLALTLWDKLLRLFKAKAPPAAALETKPLRRILFIELVETGGLVVACPALAHARRLYPDAEIHFMTFTLGKGILDLLGFPEDRQIIIRTSSLTDFVCDTLAAIKKTRRLQFDAVVNLEAFARFSAMLAYLSKAPTRAGFFRFHDEGRYIGDLITHKLIYNPHCHAAYSFLALVASLQERVDVEPLLKRSVADIPLELPRVRSDQAALDNIRAKIRELYPAYGEEHKLVLLNPNASDLVAARRWPEESFLTLTRALLERPDVLALFTGAPNERPYTETLRHALASDRVLNMAGKTTFAELIDLYNVSSMLITNDSGPAHFASLTELHVLVMFGPETPDIYGPLGPNVTPIYLNFNCSPCVSSYNQKRTPCSDNQCLKQIVPDTLLVKALAILDA